MELGENVPIHRSLVELTGLERPHALLIPTASYDEPERWDTFNTEFRDKLGCATDVLYLLNRSPSLQELEEKILGADLIYVSGGNTLKMMRRWRHLGVGKVLQAAYDHGTILSGQSAGMLCWFAYGHSDSWHYYRPDDWDYVRVKGLGWINAIGCPHFDTGTVGQLRADNFKRMLLRHSEPGIAVDNHCALQLVDGSYRVVTSRSGAGAYALSNRNGIVVVEPLEQRKDFIPIANAFPAPTP